MSKVGPAFLGPYRLLNIVHDGHGCRLWKALHEGNQQLFAIKTPLESAPDYQAHVGYLKREWEICRSIDHPRLVRGTDWVVERGRPYLVIEWFPAPNMKSLIRQGFEAVKPLLPKVVHQAAESLVALHARGWIHRDIKPENFLVDETGEVKLIDFALALRKPGFLSKLFNLGGKLQGTRSYMSPEQIRGKPLDERSDLYSLACTLYELIAGRPPFTADNPNDLLMKHLQSAPPSLEGAGRNVTPEFAQLIRRAMAKHPEGRPKSAQQFHQELQRVTVLRRNSASSR